MPISKTQFEQGEERYSIENEIVHFLHEHEEAYNVLEITEAVIDTGWSEANVEEPELDSIVGCVLDLATVSSILDTLVDNGMLERRIVDAGHGERSYYRGP
ncbi:hypothetical protein [Halobacterium zhouii]|uniref:hypothetical protein n=1 Tax=Halobacterium zhouii TaxID=2902624 RepID=UPI001E3AF0E9|nr:hypothetical protein [Halobacterium zhouii]